MGIRGIAALAMVAATATGAAAQDVASVGSMAPQPEQMRVRFQIAAMEGVLERAVQLGARRLSQQVQAVSPDMLFIAGAARAKGFLLDGYGVFFDVDVPAMRRSVAWSFRQMGRPDGTIETALTSLKRNVASVSDPQVRREMDEALQRLVRVVSPMSGPVGPAPTQAGAQPVSSGAQVAAAGLPQSPEAPPQQAAIIDDPGLAYTNEVKAALIDAMLDYGTPIPIGESQWLTIAARDDHDGRLGSGDPYDVSTIVLRISGADLSAFRAGRLTREEALAKVEAREY
jgi:hypothetical protein